MITRKQFLQGLAAAAAAPVMAPAIVRAQTAVTLDVLYANPSFARFFTPIADAFMKENPDVKIAFRQPAANYNEGHQAMLRGALTNQLPDVNFSGFNLLPELARTLKQRNQIVDLGTLIATEAAGWRDANYDGRMLALGQVDGAQMGLAFNASSPIAYYNPDLVAKAGGNPDAFPTTRNDILALAAKIKATSPNAMGLSVYINSFDSDWLFQGLVQQAGGRMLAAGGKSVAFGEKGGLEALTIARRAVTEGGMQLLGDEQSRQQFAAGGIGIIFDSPARLGTITGLVGDRFKLRTAPFAVTDKTNGGLPTGGNAAVITAQDAAKRAAAWRYVKFSTGPVAQKIAVEMTGYLPTNKRALEAEFLGAYYEKNPNARSAAMQMDKSLPWEDYGANGVRIHRAQQETITQIMRGDLTVEAGLKKLVEDSNRLMASS